MKSEEDYPVALWVKRQIGTDMISCVYKIHRTSVAMSYKHRNGIKERPHIFMVAEKEKKKENISDSIYLFFK